MRSSILAMAATATVAVALAQPHRHQHAHLHKRDTTVTQTVAGPTAYAYVLESDPGSTLDIEQVCIGLSENSLTFGDGQRPSGICDSSTRSSAVSSTSSSSHTTSTSTATVATTASSNTAAAAFYQQLSLSLPGSAASSTTTSQKASQASAQTSTQASTASVAASSSSAGSGVNTAFPDGQLSCSTFPSQYGPVALDYLGLGGWSGLQYPTAQSSAGYSDIVTSISPAVCTEGMMCSYACPAGYQKSQWPSMQGTTGQSVGGIKCSGGKLYLTNSALSTSLCIPGVGGVQAQNKASDVVAICRTDYPGTESETIPVQLSVGETQPLANPDASTYYTWQGGSTSAQYYLNPIGVSAQDACQWGTSGTTRGNWAPINLGVGHSAGKTWLSIFQNSPTTSAQYQGTVSISGDISATCSYSNGQYCGATGCNSNGCTVAVNSGTATFVISS